MTQYSTGSMRHVSRTVTIGMGVALLALLLLVIGYGAVSMEMLRQETGFRMFLGGIALSLIALAISLVGLWRARNPAERRRAVRSIIIALVIITPMSPHIIAAFSVPPVHDITTDTDNPPVFVAILPLRADAPNTSEYGGESLAAAQKAGYPDLAPLILAVPAAEAFTRAQKLVAERGWILVEANAQEGRIEATAETRFMRFKDDVVIRIRPEGEGSRVDMRSVSRFGQSDLGVNARRISQFLEDLKAS
ncbi:MAG: hypothetical protein Dbin4_02406 [Alphaproteobacteria bacterium]|nr:hypothetical protein [Alphaproteobacteria bacterium]